jgi:hypothetical protein
LAGAFSLYEEVAGSADHQGAWNMAKTQKKNPPTNKDRTDWWTDEEWAAVLAGELPLDTEGWSFTKKGEEWEVWKGLQETSNRLYRSPSGRYYMGAIIDGPPYDCADPDATFRLPQDVML